MQNCKLVNTIRNLGRNLQGENELRMTDNLSKDAQESLIADLKVKWLLWLQLVVQFYEGMGSWFESSEKLYFQSLDSSGFSTTFWFSAYSYIINGSEP